MSGTNSGSMAAGSMAHVASLSASASMSTSAESLGGATHGGRIAGYEITESVHRGRHCAVYRALDPKSGRRVVIKTHRAPYPPERELARLRREYELISRVDHPSVVRARELRDHEKGLALILEHCAGETLEERLAEGPLPLARVLEIGLGIVEALSAVHDQGIVHRDVTAANIIAGRDGGERGHGVTLLDFDISSLAPRETQAATGTGALEGTLAYCSPEQSGRMNRSVDYRSDFYNLGVTLYRAASGQFPFESDDPLELIHMHLARRPTPVDQLDPELPPAFAGILARLMAKMAEDRYQSAAGIRADLQRCLDAVRRGERPDFEVGRDDLSSRFQISERLYGRSDEVQRLVAGFERASAGHPELVLVSGYSGAGKSRLVQELQPEIVERRGLFAAGKFDQFQRNVPYASLFQALRDLVRQLIAEPDHVVAAWRQRVLDAVGASGAALTEHLPELEDLIGRQPELPELAAQEGEARFRRVLRDFVAALCRDEQPLCLFLDDLQWMDAATLAWLRRVVDDQSLGPLLIVGAFRDNEVGPSHPLAIALSEMDDQRRSAGAPVLERIELAPLSMDAIAELLGDSMLTPAPAQRELARAFHDRTGGNPFFVTQLLWRLAEDGQLRLQQAQRCWSCPLSAVESAQMADDVVSLMVDRIGRLDAACQETLQIAACIGNRFGPVAVARATARPVARIERALDSALAVGLIAREAGAIDFRFVHDRVQQAAYSMLDGDAAQRVRIELGRSMADAMEHPERDEGLFATLAHFEAAPNEIGTEEHPRLSQLHRIAASRAREAGAYAQALGHAKRAEDYLGAAATTPSRPAFEVALERADCEHLAGHDEDADQLYGRALELAPDDTARGRAYEKRVHYLTDSAQFERAFALGREGAARFGVDLPKKFVPPSLVADVARIKLATRGGGVRALADLPEMTDPRLITGARLGAAALKAAFQVKPELCVAASARLVRLCLKEGNYDDAPVAYLPVGPIFQGAILNNPEAARDWGGLCIDLLDRFDNAKQRAEVNFVYAYFAHSWTHPLKSTETYFARAYQAGLETGDVFHASCACSGMVQSLFMRGAPLEQVAREAERYMDYLRRVESPENRATVISVQRAIENLQGRCRSATSFEPASDDSNASSFDEADFVRQLADFGSEHFAHYYFVNKLGVLVTRRAHGPAVELLERATPYLKASVGMQHMVEHRFHAARLYADLLRSGHEGSARRWRGKLRGEIKRFEAWTRSNPENYGHKLALLHAEWASLVNDELEAARKYEEAIEGAAEQGFAQNEAIANELAARHYLALGQLRSARHFFREAAYAYERWGASDLVATLPDRLPGLDAGARTTTNGSAPHTGGTMGGTTNKGGTDLDVATVTKAAAAISGEVELAALLEKLLALVLENAGADYGALLLPEGGEYLLQATAHADGRRAAMMGIALDDFAEITASLVRRAVHERSVQIVDDAPTDGGYADDPRVRSARPRSLLALPLVDRGEIRAILYLENSLVAGAFTATRTELLSLLSGQFAISIENARAYGALEAKVRERTAQLETRNRLIRQTFGRYLSEEIVENLLEAPEGLTMGGSRREVTIMMTDLRGFTGTTEKLPPEKVVALLNNYLGIMTEIILAHGGTIDEFIGDAILVIFGAPIARDDDARRSIACSIAMQRAMAEVNRTNLEQGLPEVEMGIGINTGEVVVGNIGSVRRAKYGVVGANVNLASRIESFTTAGEVLISDRTRELAGPDLRLQRSFEVQPKGVEKKVPIHAVAGLGDAEADQIPVVDDGLVELPSPRPIAFTVIQGKEVGDEVTQGQLVALSERAAFVRCALPPKTFDNLSVHFGPPGGHGPVYAKVVDRNATGFTLRFTSVAPDARVHLEG